MRVGKNVNKIYKCIKHIVLCPIRVFCLHEISAKPEFSNEGPSDWMDIDVFKRKIENMRKQGYVFISLEDAYRKIQTDRLRFRKYAVLTNDDARKSLHEILPWFIEQQLPITLFVNEHYLDGKEHVIENFNPFHCLTKAELIRYVEISYGLISLQGHGLEHKDATTMSLEEFHRIIDPYKRFHAYTWGHHTIKTDNILRSYDIIPVLMDGMKNYNDASCIHRELLENYDN